MEVEFTPVIKPDRHLNGGEIVELNSPVSHGIVRAELAVHAGSAPAGLWTRLNGGPEFNLLGWKTIEEIEREFERRREDDPLFATNRFFEPGVAAPLFPLANRLTGRARAGDVLEAEVAGIRVTAPVNHGRGPGQKPHHLHGLSYDRTVQIEGRESEFLKALLPTGFFHGYWAGEAELQLTHRLEQGAYIFSMTAKNTGRTPIPVGGGAHPYFRAPSADAKSIYLRIPGRHMIEIDNYNNVLPTGRQLEATGVFNFREPAPLSGLYLDNLWVDLEKDSNGFAYAEFFDRTAGLHVRMTATTKNVIGIQAYAPAGGDFVALELVTNLPDPREELWGETPTGMYLLSPGDEWHYGYRIDIF